MFHCILFSLLVSQLAFPENGAAAEVINAGVGGNRSSQLLRRLDRDVLAQQPTVVVLMVGTNDRLNSGGFIDINAYRKNVNTLIAKMRDITDGSPDDATAVHPGVAVQPP